MQIGNFEFPDKCPDNCLFANDLMTYGQNSICIRCPILNCAGDDRALEPSDYRLDWAREWFEFFKTGKSPSLKFHKE